MASEEEMRQTIDQIILAERVRSGEKVTLRDISKKLAMNSDIKANLPHHVPYLKQKIEEVNAMSEADLAKFKKPKTPSSTLKTADADSETALDEENFDEQNLDDIEFTTVENEYEELIDTFKGALEESKIHDQIVSLLIYGSYAQERQVMGQSDINFLLVMKNDFDQYLEDKPDNHGETNNPIDNIIKSIMNELYDYLFDLIVLFERDIENVDKIGSAFGAIHALSAKNGKVLIGKNPFADYKFNQDNVQQCAQQIITETLSEFMGVLNAQSTDQNQLSTEDIAYIASEAVVDVALALCYLYSPKDCNGLTKPDLCDYFEKLVPKKYHDFTTLITEAWGYKIDINLKYSLEEFIEKSKNLGNKAALLIKEDFA